MIESFESAAVAASIGRLYRARAPDPKDTSVFRWLVPRAAVIVNVCTRDGGSIKEEWMRYTMREMPRPCCGLSLHRNGCQFGLLTKLCPTLISYKEYFFESATNGALISDEKKNYVALKDMELRFDGFFSPKYFAIFLRIKRPWPIPPTDRQADSAAAACRRGKKCFESLFLEGSRAAAAIRSVLIHRGRPPDDGRHASSRVEQLMRTARRRRDRQRRCGLERLARSLRA